MSPGQLVSFLNASHFVVLLLCVETSHFHKQNPTGGKKERKKKKDLSCSHQSFCEVLICIAWGKREGVGETLHLHCISFKFKQMWEKSFFNLGQNSFQVIQSTPKRKAKNMRSFIIHFNNQWKIKNILSGLNIYSVNNNDNDLYQFR